MESVRRLALVVLVGFVVVPTSAYAQGEITGVVRDTSGAVLPGVTVEAASPALIEKVRSVATDGSGQYRIVDLRPGAYTVTFTLPGFTTVRREGVALTGSFVARVDAELRVGSLEETVTVTGEAPTVDVQSVTRQQVLSADLIDALPTSRNYLGLARMIPGTVGGGTDVGGSQLQGTGGSVMVHGSRSQDQRITLNGVNTMTLVAGGHLGGQIPDVGSAQEVTIDHTGVSADLPTGGVRINFIPRDGGNTFANSTFFTFTRGALQADNFTQRLKDAGLRTRPDEIKRNMDLNASAGGPIRRDRVWFWFSGRIVRVENYPPVFENKNAFDPTKWTYEPDESRRAVLKGRSNNSSLRVTWQATPKNKIAATYKADSWCNCPLGSSPTRAPEAAQDSRFPRLRQEHAEWTSPVTNRLLLEAVGMHLFERWGGMHLQRRGSLKDATQAAALPSLISVQEQSTGMVYRSWTQYNNTGVPNYFYRAAVAYVTGAHAFKAGFNRVHGYINTYTYTLNPVSYRFNNSVPNQITLRATPRRAISNEDNDVGVYAQDRWTINRLTVNAALRYDYFGTSFPDQHIEPGPLVPTRDLRFPAQDNLGWHDITYRTSASYDLRGDGRTAFKVTFNKYLRGQTLNGLGQDPNPVNTLVNETNRSWNDANRDYVPDCDLLNPLANGECGPMANRNFGRSVPAATYDPDLLTGWGHRERNWEFSAGLQHEVLPRVSVDFGYFRRIWGNFQVTDNLVLGPGDFDSFSITAPRHPELPGGGGYELRGLVDVKPEKFGVPAQNYNTLSDKYGKQIEHWNGVDLNVNARLQNGLVLTGGLSTGKTLSDRCEILAKLPEMLLGTANSVEGTLPVTSVGAWTPAQFCRQESPFLTSVKGYGVYTIPRIDVQIAGTFQSSPGPEIQANYNAPNAVVQPSLGRVLSGGAANMTVNLLEPGAKYGERLNQLDLRFGKIFRVARTRTNVSLDLYNALNGDTVRTLNNNFGAWLRPTSILLARFAKISVAFDF